MIKKEELLKQIERALDEMQFYDVKIISKGTTKCLNEFIIKIKKFDDDLSEIERVDIAID